MKPFLTVFIFVVGAYIVDIYRRWDRSGPSISVHSLGCLFILLLYVAIFVHWVYTLVIKWMA